MGPCLQQILKHGPQFLQNDPETWVRFSKIPETFVCSHEEHQIILKNGLIFLREKVANNGYSLSQNKSI